MKPKLPRALLWREKKQTVIEKLKAYLNKFLNTNE